MIEELMKYQKVAYRILDNDLREKRISHAYLFTGPQSAKKKETAILFAQSLVCPSKDVWACESCDICQRIARKEYLDIKIIDQVNTSIKSEEIEDIKEYFSKTAVESFGVKAYIIDQCEKMTASAMNKLLKFLEEPDQEITAILCTDNPQRVLPTIVSRCKNVPFVTLSKEQLFQEALNKDVHLLDAHILANDCQTVQEIIDCSENEAFQVGLETWLEYLKKRSEDKHLSYFYLEEEAFKSIKKDNLKDSVAWFLKIGLVYCSDCLANNREYGNDWNKAIDRYEALGISLDDIMKILLQCKDSLLINANVSLVIDKFGYLMNKE